MSIMSIMSIMNRSENHHITGPRRAFGALAVVFSILALTVLLAGCGLNPGATTRRGGANVDAAPVYLNFHTHAQPQIGGAANRRPVLPGSE